MPSRTDSERSSRGYLPYLTLALLAVLAAYGGLWFFVYRPTEQEELQAASFQRALRFINRYYVEDVDGQQLYRAAMRGMVEQLGDRYSTFLAPEQRERLIEAARGTYAGIGVRLGQRNRVFVVEEVFDGGPAAASDVKAGDIIAAVDGQPVEDMGVEQVVALVRGEPGTAVKLELKRPSVESTVAVSVTRRRIEIPNVERRMLEGAIGYVKIAAFDNDVSAEMAEALEYLKQNGAKGLVLDLRANGGGVMEEAIEISDMFLAQGQILSLTGRHAVQEPTHRADENVALPTSVPVAVLVDQWTASAAEILAGSLQANGRATVIGVKTFGKGSVTQIVDLPDGSALVVTVARYEVAGDTVIEGQGVEPDIVVDGLPPFPEDVEQIEAWRVKRQEVMERQLQRAIESLKDRMQMPSPAGQPDAG